MDILAAILFFFACLGYVSSGTVIRIPLERRVRRDATAGGIGRLTFKNLRNEEYWGSLTIGTPPQKFEAMFDTGSHLVWVPNRNCTNCHGKNMFDETRSSSYVDQNKTISIDYAIGYMRGIRGKDVVNIAGIEVKNQDIATALEGGFQENLFDGIIGLSFASTKTSSIVPIINNFVNQKLLKRNIISFYMNRKNDPKDGGELMIGGWNTALFDSSSIDYIPIMESNYWEIIIDSMYVGQNKTFCRQCRAIVDTGNTMITGPINEVSKYIAGMNAEELENGYHFVKCDTIDGLPDLTFFINRKKYTLKGKDYTFTKPSTAHPGYCMLGLTGNFDTDWVLGIMFLSNYYSMFDISQRRVAFAPLKLPAYRRQEEHTSSNIS